MEFRGAPSEGSRILSHRPEQFNKIVLASETVYASYTFVRLRKDVSDWIGGLFTQRDVKKGEILCKYTGKVYFSEKAASRVKNQEYMMSTPRSDSQKEDDFVILDGNPSLYSNLGGYANYSESAFANAKFSTDDPFPEKHTSVVLKAKEFIPAGTEVRVDYDIGNRKERPFYKQLRQQGVPRSSLAGHEYKRVVWSHPLEEGNAVVDEESDWSVAELSEDGED